MAQGMYGTEPTICQEPERTQLSVDALDTSQNASVKTQERGHLSRIKDSHVTTQTTEHACKAKQGHNNKLKVHSRLLF